MAIDASQLKKLIDHELAHLSDARVKTHIQGLLVEPKPTLRDWDYGKPNEKYLCWQVLNDNESNFGISYCESGFGPRNPWGLVWLESNEDKAISMGMDSSWYPTFLDAYFESSAAALPIWRVFKTSPLRAREPITDEGSWDDTWQRVMEYRKGDPAARYDCDHSISYRR